jgi:hypothetical protein
MPAVPVSRWLVRRYNQTQLIKRLAVRTARRMQADER